ncbi:MAG: HAD-IB family phosphatase, partial [Minisyncoccia bacterium]
MSKKVAIFDIDGTIFRSSLLIELVNVLIDRKIFPESVGLEYAKEYLAWLDRKGSYQDYIIAVVNVFMKYIKGVRQEDLVSAAKLVIAHQENRVYRYTRDLMKKLKGDGYYLLAVSHSPKLIAEEFAKSLNFDKVYGILYEIDGDGKFTGE